MRRGGGALARVMPDGSVAVGRVTSALALGSISRAGGADWGGDSGGSSGTGAEGRGDATGGAARRSGAGAVRDPLVSRAELLDPPLVAGAAGRAGAAPGLRVGAPTTRRTLFPPAAEAPRAGADPGAGGACFGCQGCADGFGGGADRGGAARGGGSAGFFSRLHSRKAPQETQNSGSSVLR